MLLMVGMSIEKPLVLIVLNLKLCNEFRFLCLLNILDSIEIVGYSSLY